MDHWSPGDKLPLLQSMRSFPDHVQPYTQRRERAARILHASAAHPGQAGNSPERPTKAKRRVPHAYTRGINGQRCAAIGPCAVSSQVIAFGGERGNVHARYGQVLDVPCEMALKFEVGT